jgi:hypothetical protein
MNTVDFIDRFVVPTDFDLQPENVTLARDLRAACIEHEVNRQDVLDTIRATTGYEHRPRGLVLGGRRLSIYVGFRLRGYQVQFDGGRGEISKAITAISKMRPEAYSLSDLRQLTDMPDLTMRQIMSASRSRSFVVSRIVAPNKEDRFNETHHMAEPWFLIVLAGSPSEDDVRRLQYKHPYHQDRRKMWAWIKAKRECA